MLHSGLPLNLKACVLCILVQTKHLCPPASNSFEKLPIAISFQNICYTLKYTKKFFILKRWQSSFHKKEITLWKFIFHKKKCGASHRFFNSPW